MLTKDITPETRIVDLTVGQLIDIIAQQREPAPDEKPTLQDDGKKYVYRYAGLMDLFKCGRSKAYRIVKSGKIDAAITKVGTTMIIDADMALKLAAQ